MPERSDRLIVSDTGPLISLEKLSNGYNFIRLLYDRLLVPQTVMKELVQGQVETADQYVERFSVGDLFDIRTVARSAIPDAKQLDPGERDAILLARSEELPILIEEEAGRRVARYMGLSVSGIAGQILKAVRLGLLSRSAGLDRLRELRHCGRINTMVYGAIEEAIRNTR